MKNYFEKKMYVIEVKLLFHENYTGSFNYLYAINSKDNVTIQQKTNNLANIDRKNKKPSRVKLFGVNIN
jgi:dephospho-CoA kinase